MDGTLSPADIAVLSGNNGNNGDGFANGGWGAWIIIFLIFAFAGWGRNGNNGFGGGGNDAGNSIPFFQSLDTDFATLERKLDTIQAGVCDSTFALNNTIVNGNNAIQNALCQGFSGVNQNLVTQGYETRIGINGLGAEIASCCCNLQNSMCTNTRDIIDAINGSYNNLHNEIVANRMEDKNIQIQAQQNEINALRLKASQEAQNAYLINQLKPCPQPSFVVQPPTPVNFPTNCCGQFVGYNSCECNGYY